MVLIARLLLGMAYLAAPAVCAYRQLSRSSLTTRERLGLALVLGPALMSLLVTACRLAGLSMEAAAWSTFGLACAAALLPGRRGAEWRAPSRVDAVAGVVAIAVALAWMASFWISDERMRIFNWHALMQIDICNSLQREPLPPQEPEMAGLRCSYAWIVHCLWAAQAQIAGLPPTRMMTFNNVACAVAQLLLGCGYARRLGLPAVTAWAAALLGVIGTNAFALAAAGQAAGIAIDWRLAPALGKFCNLDTMPLALPLLTGLFAWAARDPLERRLDAPVFLLTAVALALVYPVLLPSMAAATTAFCASHWLASRSAAGGTPSGFRWFPPTPVLTIATAFGVAVAAAVWFVSLLSADRATPGLRIVSPLTIDSAQAGKLARMAIAIVPLVPFALISLVTRDLCSTARDASRSRRAATAVAAAGSLAGVASVASVALKSHSGMVATTFAALAGCLALGWLACGGRRAAWWSGLASLLAYCVCDVEMLEYKYVLAATVVLAPFACEGIAKILSASGQGEWLCLGTVAMLAAATLYGGLGVGILLPDNFAAAPRVVDRGPQLALAPDDPHAAWVAAIRSATPADAVVVSRDDAVHVAAFLDRRLYVPSDVDGVGQTGYSISSQQNMTDYRGHSREDYDARRAAVRRLFEDDARRAEALEEILSRATAVAIHARGGDAKIAAFLDAFAAAAVVYRDNRDIVWLVRKP